MNSMRMGWLGALLIWSLSVQGQERVFGHLSTEQGLSQNMVNSICRDALGFVWVGTEDGLNRWDGHRNRIFRRHQGDTSSLADDYVYCLAPGPDGQMWVGTAAGGVQRFDPRTQRFRHYPPAEGALPSADVRSLLNTPVALWIGTFDKGIARLVHGTDRIEAITLPMAPSEVLRQPIFAYDSAGILWVGSAEAGLFELQLRGLQVLRVRRHTMQLGRANALPSNSITALHIDAKGNLLLVAGNSLWMRRAADAQFVPLPMAPDRLQALGRLRAISTDKQHRIWLAGTQGLAVMSSEGRSWQHFRHHSGQSMGLRHDYLLCLYLDQQELLWMGTNSKGLMWVDTRPQPFALYRHQPNNEASLSDNLIRSIYATDSGAWVGTVSGALNYLDTRNDQVQRHALRDSRTNQSIEFLSALYQPSANELWVGTWRQGLYCLERPKPDAPFRIAQHFVEGRGRFQLTDSTVQGIFRDRYQRVWVSTELGFNLVDRRLGVRQFFAGGAHGLGDNRLQGQMAQTSDGSLWVGSWGGLVRLLPPRWTGDTVFVFQHYAHRPSDSLSIPDNRVTSVCVDTAGILWVGTYGGGMAWARPNEGASEPRWRTIDTRHGLPNDMIYALLPDRHGAVWASTNNGLACYRPWLQSFQNFQQADGLQNNQFYWGAASVSANGQLFFGGIDGLNAFRPQNFRRTAHPPLARVSVLNQTGVRQHQLWRTEQHDPMGTVRLPAGLQSIELGLTALHFDNPSANRFSYRLEGLDDQWRALPQGEHWLRFASWPPGTYTLHLRAANAQGLWSEDVFRLRLIQEPFWWQTLTFRLFLGLVLLLVGWAWFRWRVRRLRQRNRTLELRVAARTNDLEVLNAELRSAIERLRDQNEQLDRFTQELRAQQDENLQLNEELSQTNEELNATNESLKQQTEQLMEAFGNLTSAQKQLVQSEKMAALGVLTAGVAHEINNPINFISSSIHALHSAFEAVALVLGRYRSLLRQAPMPDLEPIVQLEQDIDLEFYLEGIPEMFRHIDDGIRRTTEIVRSLKHFSHQDTGQQQATDLHLLIDSNLVMLHHLYKSRITVEKHYGELPYVRVWPGRINQVLMNVLSNAIQAIEGSGTIRIHTRLDVPTNSVELCFEDTGCGIDDATIDKIFDPFFTTKTVGQGSGLGLSISYDIVREHGGRLSVRSQPGVGSSFCIRLPVDGFDLDA